MSSKTEGAGSPAGSVRGRPPDDIVALAYRELRVLAASFFRAERAGHSLQPTALVHEAWLRLATSRGLNLDDRSSFLAMASVTMRRILVEHARRRLADKRGGGWTRVMLEGGPAQPNAVEALEANVLAVHEALDQLAELHERQARIVEMRWFGGLTVPEIADVLGLVPRTVEKDWTMAKAWLRRRLAAGAA